MRKILKPLFWLTVIYSFVALKPLAINTGGPCNAGVVLVGIGLFLIICATLTFFAIKNITRSQQTTTRNRVAKVFVIVALLFWVFWAVSFAYDEIAFTLLYFTPFLLTIITTAFFTFSQTITSNMSQPQSID